MSNVISALGVVKDGAKSVLLNLSNARQINYETLEEMTEAQKQGVIICPDYPLNEGNMIPASTISYGNGSVETAISNTQSSISSIFQTGATATQAIPSGTFFYLNGTLVKAKTAIASGATFTLNTNYEVVTAGGLNEVIKTEILTFTTDSGGNIGPISQSNLIGFVPYKDSTSSGYSISRVFINAYGALYVGTDSGSGATLKLKRVFY